MSKTRIRKRKKTDYTVSYVVTLIYMDILEKKETKENLITL